MLGSSFARAVRYALGRSPVPPPAAILEDTIQDLQRANRRLHLALDAALAANGTWTPNMYPADVEEARDLLGRMVHQVRTNWDQERGTRRAWFAAWEDLDPDLREVSMRIGEALFDAGRRSAEDGAPGLLDSTETGKDPRDA